MLEFLELILTEAEPHTGRATFLVSSCEFNEYRATITVISELYQGYGIALCLAGENNHA